MSKKLTLKERFWQKVDKTSDPNNCWIWTANKSKSGNGLLKLNKTSVNAARISWEIYNKISVPNNMIIIHKCKTPACVNPLHLDCVKTKAVDPQKRFWKFIKVNPKTNCHEWQGTKNKHGYGYFHVDKQRKMIRSHRYIWEIYNGPIPNGMFVMHKCDNPCCVNVLHLTLGTPRDNTRDKIIKKRENYCSGKNHYLKKYPHKVRKGERHHQAKLTKEQVIAIRNSYQPTIITMKQLSEKYSVSIGTISDIVYRKSWKHL